MKKLTPFLIGSILLVPALASVAWAQTPDETIEKHLAAIGGREALGKLTSRRTTGTITITTAQGELSGPAEISNKAPNKTRAVMTLDLSAMGVPDKMVVEQIFDGTVAWALNSLQGNNEISGNQLQNLKNNAFPSPLLTYKQAGTKVELVPKEQVAGKDTIVLLMTPKEGSAVRLFLDPQTYLVVRTVVTVNNPMLGGDVTETADLSDYRVVDGVKVPFVISRSNPAQNTLIKVTKVEHNVPLDDALFRAK